jgi:hypothetical protein
VTNTNVLEGLADTVRSALAPDLGHGVRVDRARMVAEQVADLRDLVSISSAVIGGSEAVDVLRAVDIQWAGRDGSDRVAAEERILARRVAGELRAAQLLADNPGIVPRPVEVGTGSTGLGGGLPLVRRFALLRDFVGGGAAPVTPGVVEGDVAGDIIVEGTAPTNAVFTVADVGSARARLVAIATALFSEQVRDWSDQVALTMLDQTLVDIADRAGEVYLGGQLVAGAGATRVAGATDITLAAALDAAEAGAATALNGGDLLLLVNPANLPRVRRVLAPSWIEGLPHPTVAASVGVVAGTAAVVATDAVHLFRDEPIFLQQSRPDRFGFEVSASRPLYLSIRLDTGRPDRHRHSGLTDGHPDARHPGRAGCRRGAGHGTVDSAVGARVSVQRGGHGGRVHRGGRARLLRRVDPRDTRHAVAPVPRRRARSVGLNPVADWGGRRVAGPAGRAVRVVAAGLVGGGAGGRQDGPRRAPVVPVGAVQP